MASKEITVKINSQQVESLKQFVRREILRRAGEPGPGVDAYAAKAQELDKLKRDVRELVAEALEWDDSGDWHSALVKIGKLVAE